MKKSIVVQGFLLLPASYSFAHTALLSCYDEGNGYILCEGGFSDGASAEGVEFRLEQNGKEMMRTKLDEFGEVYFEKPSTRFTVILNGGEGHIVHIDGNDISE